MQEVTQQLQTILQRQLDAVNQLDAILQQEFEALKDNNIDSLVSLLDQKQPLLSQVEQTESTRMALLAQYQVPPTKEGFEAVLQKLASQPLNKLWQELIEKLPACKNQNEVNGRLLEMKQGNTDQILSLLTGKASSAGEVYNSQGSRSNIQQNGFNASA